MFKLFYLLRVTHRALFYVESQVTPVSICFILYKIEASLVYRSPTKRLVMFDYREGRGREGPQECLKDFKGYLQTDGYAVYEDFGNTPGVTLLGCMAHARRKFDEAKDNDLARAEYVLTQMQKLYAIERHVKSEALSAIEIVELRQAQSVPILIHLKEWMLENYKVALPKSNIGKALHYSLQRWDKLMVYTTDGRLESIITWWKMPFGQ